MQKVESASEVHRVGSAERVFVRRSCKPLEGVSEAQPPSPFSDRQNGALGTRGYSLASPPLRGQGVDAALRLVSLQYIGGVEVGKEKGKNMK